MDKDFKYDANRLIEAIKEELKNRLKVLEISDEVNLSDADITHYTEFILGVFFQIRSTLDNYCPCLMHSISNNIVASMLKCYYDSAESISTVALLNRYDIIKPPEDLPILIDDHKEEKPPVSEEFLKELDILLNFNPTTRLSTDQ